MSTQMRQPIHRARLQLLRLGIRIVELPLSAASATTWWLEGIRTRLRTALALAELEGRR